MSDVRPALPSRRGVLTAAGALLVAGCTGSADPQPPPGPTPDQRLAARVAVEIRALAVAYAAAVARHPGTRAELSPFAAEHDAHVTALTPLTHKGGATSTPGSTSAPPSSPSAPPSPVASSPTAAVAELSAAEDSAASRRRGQARRAGPELARLLASIAACEAVHAVLLGGRG